MTAAGPPEVVIGLPHDFRDIPLPPRSTEQAPPDLDAWVAAADHFLDLLPADRPPRHRALALTHLKGYSELLAAGGAVKAAACLGQSDGRLSTASVLVSWVPAAGAAPADVAALGLYRALDARFPDRNVHAIELPVGPAVAVIAERIVAGDDGTGPVDIPVRSIEVSIPIDEQPWVLVVALSSPSLPDWDNYEAIMATVCRSIHLAEPATHPDGG